METRATDALNADALHKIRRGQNAAHSRPPARGKHVIAAADVVAERLRAPRTHENRPCRLNFLEQRIRIVRKAEMLGREAAREFARTVDGRREQDRASALS